MVGKNVTSDYENPDQTIERNADSGPIIISITGKKYIRNEILNYTNK